MSTEDEMTIDERRKYLRRMKKRYCQANRKEREHLLDEMEAVTELHRKSLIRLMNSPLGHQPYRPLISNSPVSCFPPANLHSHHDP